MVANAIKFTPGGGSIRITARVEDRSGDLLLLVSDTGIGIVEGDLQRAFEPFVQLDASLARRFPGSGLGLYVSRITARAHGGDLLLSSEPGVGTTAVLRLPAYRLVAPPPISCPDRTRLMTALSPLAATDRLFFEREDAALDRDAAQRIVAEALAGCDDGELFLEYRESEQISLDDGRIRHAGFESGSGFGLRAILGEETGYAHAGEMSEPALRRAAATVSAVRGGGGGIAAEPPRSSNARLYADANPLGEMDFAARTAILAEIDAYARAKDPRVVQVMASMYGEWQAVQVMRADGRRVADLRPLVRLNVSVVVEQDGRRETGGHGTGGRFGYSRLLTERDLARRRGRGAAPGAGQPREPSGAGRGDGGRARQRLARHPAARGDRPRARRRLQPQEDLGLLRAAGPAHRGAGRDGGG